MFPLSVQRLVCKSLCASQRFSKKLLQLSCPLYKKFYLLYYCSSPRATELRSKYGKRLDPDEVILYEYNNPKFFKRLCILSVAQYVVWFAFGICILDVLAVLDKQEDAIDSNTFIGSKVGREKIRQFLAAVMVLGTALLILVYIYVRRSVKQILLTRDKNVVFITYDPFKETRETIHHLNDVSGVSNRAKAKNYLKLKVNKQKLWLLLDMNGVFKNPKLFDTTVNMKREFK